LYTNIRRNHGPQESDALAAVHAKKHEDDRLGFLARGYGPAEQ
jgi:hypothetical protein